MELFLFLKFALNQFFFYFLVSKKIVSKSFTTTEKKTWLGSLETWKGQNKQSKNRFSI